MLLQKQFQSQLQDIGKNSGATIRFPEPSANLEAVAITAAPTRIRDVAKALLNLVPMTFNLVSDDPKLAAIVESSDFHYAIIDRIKVVHGVDISIKQNSDTNANLSQPRFTFQFQYLRPNFDNLKRATDDFCKYLTENGATIESVAPSEPSDPETKPFDQEKSNSYGQGSVTQPYHSAAQIAAAAQGNLHPSFNMGSQHMNFQPGMTNGVYHQNPGLVPHTHPNGFHGHIQGQHHFGRGFQQMAPSSFPAARGSVNGNRHGHHGPVYQTGYSPFQPHPSARGAGNHINHYNHFNAQYIGPTPMNGSGAFSRRFGQSSPTPPGEGLPSPTAGTIGYQEVSRAAGLNQTPLETLGSLELPDIPSSGPVNGANYGPHQDTRTPSFNTSPYSPSAQSYVPPHHNLAHHNSFQQNQGYLGLPPRYPS